MGSDRTLIKPGQIGNPFGLQQSARLLKVRRDNIDGILLQQRLESFAKIQILSGTDGNRRAFAQDPEAVDAFRRGRIRIRTAPAGKAAEAIVEDDGPGVPEELRPRLFARLATARSGGSGLGLYISRALAEEAGGSLELLDAPGGAKFRLRLPSAPET